MAIKKDPPMTDTEKAAMSSAAKAMGSRGGKKRALALSKEKRKEIAQNAAAVRWGT